MLLLLLLICIIPSLISCLNIKLTSCFLFLCLLLPNIIGSFLIIWETTLIYKLTKSLPPTCNYVGLIGLILLPPNSSSPSYFSFLNRSLIYKDYILLIFKCLMLILQIPSKMSILLLLVKSWFNYPLIYSISLFLQDPINSTRQRDFLRSNTISSIDLLSNPST